MIWRYAVLLVSLPAFAGGYTVNNYVTTEEVTEEVTNLTVTEGLSDEDISEVLSYSAAISNVHLDFDTFKWQGGVGVGYHDGENAFAGMLGKRFETLDALWSVSYSEVLDHSAIGVGASFRF